MNTTAFHNTTAWSSIRVAGEIQYWEMAERSEIETPISRMFLSSSQEIDTLLFLRTFLHKMK